MIRFANILPLLCLYLVAGFQQAHAREQVRIIGSSTVFPFVASAAEQYGDKTGERTPIVESIGTGAGMVHFCKGSGAAYPDIVNASRKMLPSEKAQCEKHKVGEIIEVPLGMDGIVVASAIDGIELELTRRDLFLALSASVPIQGTLIKNPYKRWQDVNPDLPDIEIEVYGPKSTSGTRDAFVELVMEPVCMGINAFVSAYPDAKNRKKACHTIREDGAYIEAGENDNLIVQKLSLNNHALGIFGYSYLDQNIDKIVAHPIDGVSAEFDHIADGSYPVSRSLYMYVKQKHLNAIDGLAGFLKEITSEAALSEDGYLVYKGLIPYQYEQREAVRRKVSTL